MYETESRFPDESGDQIHAAPSAEEKVAQSSLAVRRRIERLRELHRLRKLLDDPDFDDLS